MEKKKLRDGLTGRTEGLEPSNLGSYPGLAAMKKMYCSQCKRMEKTVVDGRFYWDGHPVCEEHFRESVRKAQKRPEDQ